MTNKEKLIEYLYARHPARIPHFRKLDFSGLTEHLNPNEQRELFGAELCSICSECVRKHKVKSLDGTGFTCPDIEGDYGICDTEYNEYGEREYHDCGS